MNIDKYMKKSYGFFAKTPKEQREKADKLKKIITKLRSASKKLSKDMAKTNNKEKKERKCQELEVVNKLIKKADKRMKKLIEDTI